MGRVGDQQGEGGRGEAEGSDAEVMPGRKQRMKHEKPKEECVQPVLTGFKVERGQR